MPEVLSRALFRARELASCAVTTRRASGGVSTFGNVARMALLAALLWAAVAVAAPAAIAMAAAAKSDFAGLPGALASYADEWLLDGWSYVAAVDMPRKGELCALSIALFAAGWLVLALYAAYNARSSFRRNVFGGPASKRSGAKGTAMVETSQVVLAATTRTWKPGERLEHAGLVLGYSPLLHRYYLSGEQDHTMVIAPPGVGKTTRVVYPTIHAILASEDSAIIYDPKGELYDNTSEDAVRSGSKVICIDYANWRRSDPYNTLSEITLMYRTNMADAERTVRLAVDARVAGRQAEAAALALEARNYRIEALSKADSLAADHAEAVVPDKEGNDQFWRPSARSLLRALSLLTATYEEDDWVGDAPAPSAPRPEQRTLKTIRNLLDIYGKPQKRQVGKTVEDYVPLEDLFAGLDADHPASKAFAQAKNSPNMTLGGIISTLLQVVDAIVTEQSNMMSYATDFRFEDIGREKTIVYLIVPEESPAKFAYLPIFTVQAYQAFARLARRNGGRMPRNVHFVQEELGNTPYILRYANMIGAGRGYGCRFHGVLQNPYQLNKIYGDKEAEVIRSSINTTLYLKVNDLKTAKELSEAIGSHTVGASTTGSSTPVTGIFAGSTSSQERDDSANLVPPEKLLAWDPLWGSFARRSKVEPSMLNTLVFRRHEANVALYPTTGPTMLPTFRAFGLHRRGLARDKALRAQAVDLSAERIVVPPWGAEALSEAQRTAIAGSFEAGGLDAATSAAIEREYWRRVALPDAARAARAMAGAFPGGDAREYAQAALQDAKEQVARSVSLANRLCKSIESAAGLGPPYSCELAQFKAVRTDVRRMWLETFAVCLDGEMECKEAS